MAPNEIASVFDTIDFRCEPDKEAIVRRHNLGTKNMWNSSKTLNLMKIVSSAVVVEKMVVWTNHGRDISRGIKSRQKSGRDGSGSGRDGLSRLWNRSGSGRDGLSRLWDRSGSGRDGLSRLKPCSRQIGLGRGVSST